MEEDGQGNKGIVLDAMKGWRRIGANLSGVVREIGETCRRYNVTEVTGDRYGGGWVREAFEREGLRYVDAPLSRSETYIEVDPLFAQGLVALVEHSQLVRELKILERRPRSGGRDQVDHPRGQHDDHANAFALAVAVAMRAEARARAGSPMDSTHRGAAGPGFRFQR